VKRKLEFKCRKIKEEFGERNPDIKNVSDEAEGPALTEEKEESLEEFLKCIQRHRAN